jgi:phospholipid transport system substrate-binding protein
MNKKIMRLGLLTVALCIGHASSLQADAPMKQIRETIDRAMSIVQEPMNGNKSLRRERLREILLPRFDFAEMAKRSLAVHWDRYRDRQDEFVSAFTRFVVDTYVSTIEHLKDKKIVYTHEQFNGTIAQINTQVVPTLGDPILIDYRLHLVGEEEWKIYDVLVEKVSLVDNFRSQFSRVLKIASFDELLRKLQEKRSERGG